jgi:hypothetical protein
LGSNEYLYHVGDGNDFIWPNASPSAQKDRLNLQSLPRSAVSITLTSQTEVLITVISTGQTILIHGGYLVLIQFSDLTVEYNNLGVDVRFGTTSIRPGWKDSDGDGFPDDVENALNAFNATAANAQNATIYPVTTTIADASITVAVGNRYPTVSAALAAAEIARAGRPYVFVKVEPGTYAEDLNLNLQGVFIQGSGSAGRAIIVRKNPYIAPVITGKKLAFDRLCFGQATSPLELNVNATDYSEGIRFTNCLFQDRLGIIQFLAPRVSKINTGDISFIHCTFTRSNGIYFSSNGSSAKSVGEFWFRKFS